MPVVALFMLGFTLGIADAIATIPLDLGPPWYLVFAGGSVPSPALGSVGCWIELGRQSCECHGAHAVATGLTRHAVVTYVLGRYGL
jgi:hypothetical protein